MFFDLLDNINISSFRKIWIDRSVKRVSISIPSNIAEGSSKNSNKDFIRFLRIAIGSAYEIETQLLIARDHNFLTNKQVQVLTKELEEIIKMISKFIKTLSTYA